MEDTLKIRGARQHNLKNINLDLPKNKLIVFTGLSGSGKSSLAFDTIYAEGQRRYVESLSSYARQFLGIMDKPDVDSIEGLSPAISIDQKSTSHNPRSTVGTVTEIYDYLRLLYARIGHPHCPVCGREISKQSPQQIVEQILRMAVETMRANGDKTHKFLLLSPVVRDRKGEFTTLFDNVRAKGYRQVRVDNHIVDLFEDIVLIKTNKHSVDVVIDRITIDVPTAKIIENGLANGGDPAYSSIRGRVADAVEQALGLSEGLVIMGSVLDADFTMPDKPKNIVDHIFSEKFSCPIDNISISEIEPRTFSFNSPHGACPTCSGIGSTLTVDPTLVINPELSISEGGILPFAKMFFHDTWFSRVVTTVAQKHNIDMRKPLRLLTPKQRDVLLHGTGDEEHKVPGTNRQGELTAIVEPYPGIIGELKKRYLESDSEYMRGEIEKYMRQEICPTCEGKRLKKEALTITVDALSIADVTNKSIEHSLKWIQRLQENPHMLLSGQEKTIATPILNEISARLHFLVSVGLEYLTLARGAASLAGGEAQRIRLASQIGSGLSGVLYVLDEPSIGLHQRDNHRLVQTLKKLRDLGNTVLVVEHDREMMEEADYLVDIGPGAGEHGGAIIAEGTVSEVKENKQSVTAPYLKETKQIKRPRTSLKEQTEPHKKLILHNATENNLKQVTIEFPLGTFTCVTGVSGSGKSTLIVETLFPALQNHFNFLSKAKPGAFEKIEGLEHIDKAILIDQSPIGRTPRSNPATYVGIFSVIRDLFANLPEAKLRGYKPGRFSFNVKGGRCEACEGEGQKKIEMQFLSDIYVTCEVCHGTRYNQETLEVHYHGKSIAQILDMTVSEATNFFAHYPSLSDKLKTITEVGLGYIHLGQPAPTLSGGEAQRVKLATELSRRSTGKTIYILDEPTTGLHFADLEKLLNVLHLLASKGNTVIVIEHNLDIIKNADWIIDLGPEGGDAGGKIIAAGTPEDIARHPGSYTGQFLKQALQH
jgi:excinuclease ABC subunit A